MSSEIRDIFEIEQLMEDNPPEHEKKVLQSAIERITGNMENRLEAPETENKTVTENKIARPKM
jgi:hypothetical protein